LLVHVHHNDPGLGQFRELERGETDRTGPDDQNRFIGLGTASIHGMATDRQRFHQRQLVERQLG